MQEAAKSTTAKSTSKRNASSKQSKQSKPSKKVVYSQDVYTSARMDDDDDTVAYNTSTFSTLK
jgi:hypothetical protein